MADKTDGITDLTKLLIAASKKFSRTEYSVNLKEILIKPSIHVI